MLMGMVQNVVLFLGKFVIVEVVHVEQTFVSIGFASVKIVQASAVQPLTPYMCYIWYHTRGSRDLKITSCHQKRAINIHRGEFDLLPGEIEIRCGRIKTVNVGKNRGAWTAHIRECHFSR